jgi:branched-chain amino acid transport system permease protein
MNYYFHLIVVFEIYILLAFSANQITGMSGLVSLCIAIFYGIGAYSTAILEKSFYYNFWFSLIISILISGCLSLLLSFISNKVRNLYFSLATLSLQIIFFNLLYNWISVTNGPFGIVGIRNPELFGYKISTPMDFAILGGIFVIIIILFFKWFYRTFFCMHIIATRDDHIAMINFGKNPNFYKSFSIIISSSIAAIAGSLYATYTSFIDPSSFTLDDSILILSIILIGGSGGIIGPITGAFIYTILPEIIKFLQLPENVASNMRMIIFATLLILIVRLKPRGIFGKYIIQ